MQNVVLYHTTRQVGRFIVWVQENTNLAWVGPTTYNVAPLLLPVITHGPQMLWVYLWNVFNGTICVHLQCFCKGCIT